MEKSMEICIKVLFLVSLSCHRHMWTELNVNAPLDYWVIQFHKVDRPVS